MSQCTQCDTPGKYKCSKCTAAYCSIPCYKAHQGVCVPPQQLPVEKVDDSTPSYNTKVPPMFANNERVKALFAQNDESSEIIDDSTGKSVLPHQQLLALLRNETIINMIQDHELQKIIMTINQAPDIGLQMLCLRFQIEFNQDFSTFIEGLLDTIKKPDENVQQDQKDAIDKLNEYFDNEM